MYATCLHCHRHLGANERVERFPVGRRLAFDAARGRLWVVCARCRQWNLSPLEERWEAIEQCERLFRETPLRASTDQVGLARLGDGLELVRVGRPAQPEMAAWRYGAALRRRRRRFLVPAVGVMSATYAGQVVVGAGLVGVGATMAGLAVVGGLTAAVMLRTWRPRVVLADGRVRRLRMTETESVRLTPDGGAWGVRWTAGGDETRLGGQGAVRALRTLVASANLRGARDAEVGEAVRLLEATGGPERFLARLARASDREQVRGLAHLPSDVRLGLEMALHESTERRALEGELALLAADWRLAEEIAAIADDLLLPAAVLDPARRMTDPAVGGLPT